MTDLTDQHIISSILEKTGILENKSLLVEIIEDELKLEMMERFDVVEIKPTDDNDPLTYGLDASTYFDLYCASKIQPRFYKTITSAQRSTLLPDLPPIAESVPGYDINAWIGMFGPAGLPKPIVEKLYGEVTRSLKKPDLAKQMADQGVEPWLATPQEFAARLRTDYDQLGRAFKIIATPKK